MNDIVYDGQLLTWNGHGVYKATSGMKGSQHPSKQCVKETGPVPEGTYYIPLIDGGYAKDNGAGVCQLEPSWQIQRIPRGPKAGACEPYWANWGKNRVRFEPNDIKTKNACSPHRNGFYLHDSVKGFSHGCIEVEVNFFTELRMHLKTKTNNKLILKIEYTKGRVTNGGTKAP